MSKTLDLTAKIRFQIEVDRLGPGLQPEIDALRAVKLTMGDVNVTTQTFRTTTTSAATSVRYLLLNLRMFSFGIRTLRREFGDTNPALEAFSTTLLITAAVGTSLISATTLLKGAIATLGPIVAGLTFGLGALGGTAKILIGVLGGPASVVTVLLSLVAIPVALWAMESAAGISALRREAKGLKEDLSMMEAQLESLRMEQDKFNLGTSATSIHLMELRRALKLAGGENEALESQIAASVAELANQRIEAARAELAIQELTIANAELASMTAESGREINAMLPQMIGRSLSMERLNEAIQNLIGRGGGDSMAPLPGRERNPIGLGGIGQILINFTVSRDAEGHIVIERGGGSRGAGDRVIQNQYAPPGVQE